MNRILKKLAGGDRRSIGRSNEVVSEVLARPGLFRELFEGMLNEDPVIRMRAADAVEKISREHPDLLKPYKRTLLTRIAEIDQQEVRWHVASMIPRLALTRTERAVAFDTLLDYLKDKSSIVRTFAMQALADLATQNASLRPQVIPLLEELAQIGTPAMRSRGRKLLKSLNRKRVRA
jgi:HEAT repeat protein